jgi:predicted molibdopterin-dependent oxidoreductase YjgC
MRERITKPYIKRGGNLVEVPFEEAFQYIGQRLQKKQENGTLVMSSGSYSNETLYLLQRLARTALNTNALNAFDYYRRGTDFFADKNDILPFAELFQSDKFYCLFNKTMEIPDTLKAVFEILERCPNTPQYWFNTADTLQITDFHAFFRSVNYYLIQHHLEKGIYVDVLGKNYGEYKQALKAEDYAALLLKNSLQDVDIQQFVDDMLSITSPAFIVWEAWLTEAAYHELENLCMLIDVQSKPATGFLTIKREINTQGLFDMGIFPHIAPGGHKMNAEMQQKMENVLQTSVCVEPVDVAATLDINGFSNVLLWNANLLDMPQDIVNQLEKANFSLLHTAYFPENADLYDVILPADLPEELSGTYTDTAKVPHQYVSDSGSCLEYNNLQQISHIASHFGFHFPDTTDEVFLEYISFMEAGCHSSERHFFKW